MREMNNIHYLEDSLLTWKIVETIRSAHSLRVEKIFRHVNIAGFEVDAVAICKTRLEWKERWVGFELKENDIEKAFAQACWRRNYFDYFYVVIDWEVADIVNWLLKKNLKDKIDGLTSSLNGIGFVSSREDVLVLKSKFKQREEIEAAVEKGRMVSSDIVKLVNFLHGKRSWRFLKDFQNL